MNNGRAFILCFLAACSAEPADANPRPNRPIVVDPADDTLTTTESATPLDSSSPPPAAPFEVDCNGRGQPLGYSTIDLPFVQDFTRPPVAGVWVKIIREDGSVSIFQWDYPGFDHESGRVYVGCSCYEWGCTNSYSVVPL